MLRAQLRRIRDRVLLTVHDPLGSTRRSVERACDGFMFPEGRRDELITAIAFHLERMTSTFERGDPAFAQQFVQVGERLNRAGLWHEELKFRSYVDVGVEVKVLRLLAEQLSPLDPLAVTTAVLAQLPDARAALLLHAGLLLEEGDYEGAIESSRRALRVQAVCITAQQTLFRAYAAKRAAGSQAEELKVLDYDLTDKFCQVPFTHFSTGYKGSAHPCSCPAWVPFPIGNVLEAESADAVWNSPAAQEIRRSIHDGDYSYCSRTLCSFISAEKLPKKSDITDPVLRGWIDSRVTVMPEMPRMVELSYDTTCNLACPSCRTELRVASADEQDLYAASRDRVLLPLLKNVHGVVYLSGGGEAFASKHTRSILAALNRREYPGLSVYLISNGQLITPGRWNEFPNLPEMLSLLSISIDAARAGTYEQLRRPGKWEPLLKNLEFIAAMRRAGTIGRLSVNFVVQQANYREMLEFLDLGERFAADQVWFQRVTNYGAYDEATFSAIDVTSPAHPEHAQLLEILRDPRLRTPRVNMQMLLALLPEFVASDERIEVLYHTSPAVPRVSSEQ